MTEPSRGLVSVIIPCHNRSEPLRECLESVVNQTYGDLEIIVVDDASTEDIETVVRDVDLTDGTSARYLRSDENVGPGRARELGRQRASGDYICYLDSDDLWHREKIAKQVDGLRSNRDAGMCYCTTVEFSTVPVQDTARIRPLSNRRFTSFLPTVLTEGRPWCTSSCMWTREASELIGPWFAGWTWEDYEYDCRAGCHDIEIEFVPERLCYYRAGSLDDHLSDSDPSVVEQRRILATFEIIRSLEAHGKLNDEKLRRRVLRMLYDRAMPLYACGEEALATKSMSEIRRLGSGCERIAQFARLMILAPYVLSSSQIARIGRRLRRMLPETSS